VTTQAGVEVLGPDGRNLGVIPTPRGVITGRSAARTRRRSTSCRAAPPIANGTEVANAAQVWAIQMQAQGIRTGRNRLRSGLTAQA
jgi:hypothetical protein